MPVAPRKRASNASSAEDVAPTSSRTRSRVSGASVSTSSSASTPLATPSTGVFPSKYIDLSSDDGEPSAKRSRSTRGQPSRSIRATKPTYVFNVPDDDSDLDMPIAIPSLPKSTRAKRTSSTTDTEQSACQKSWNIDALALTRKTVGARKGTWSVEGYVGLEGTFTTFRIDGQSVKFGLTFEDIDGRKRSYVLAIAFNVLDTYPARYETQITLDPPSSTTTSVRRILDRFLNVHNLSISVLLTRLLFALQGDDEASGGRALDAQDALSSVADGEDDDEDMVEEDEEMMFESQTGAVGPGRGFEVAKGSSHDMGEQWGKIKEDFAQAKTMGYRPGLTQVSDDWVISYSIPFKNIGIDPNELALWDDGLAEAWADNQRFTMLIRGASYSGVPIEKMQYYLALDRDYKPSLTKITDITRGKHDTSGPSAGSSHSFFLSDAIVSHLKSFPLAYAFRTTYAINWQTADKYAMDQMLAIAVRENGTVPDLKGADDEPTDPVTRGWTTNIPLIAFHWALRRFRLATKYCLNCGQEMELAGMRPYVCDNALCFFTMMSMGLGPSVEHSIRAHPNVCDILLSFAHAALGTPAPGRGYAGTTANRMSLPLGINIVVPADIAASGSPTDLDDLDETSQRTALVRLIETLPPVSELKTNLDNGISLTSLVRDKKVLDGAITVLRWVICSCRAYLKEVKPGQGVVNNVAAGGSNQAYDPYGHGAGGLADNIRQFTFVVGNPEQEDNFKREIEVAKAGKPSLAQHPTMLAYHGSAIMRWHNILRTGLDFAEIACGRAYGNGVYFAAQAEVSLGTYAQPAQTFRPNADLRITRAMSLVELVNVPETFVSRDPYYVVNNTKQIKPFLLVVQVQPDAPAPANPVGAVGTSGQVQAQAQAATAAATVPPVKPSVVKSGRIFQHDPALAMQPTWFGQGLEVRMPDTLKPAHFIDTQPDSPSDKALYDYVPPQPKKVLQYSPAPKSRYNKVHMMPNPTYTSTSATKAIMREHKATMKVQEEAGLPFWLVPDGDRVYSWAIEMFDFPKDSALWGDMKAKGVKSILAEVRFPDSFPTSPPFIRILHPRFMPFLQGGGGNITAGGSVCNEILTSTGWNMCYTVEAIVRDVMVNMAQPDAAGRQGRLDRNWDTAYGVQEAMEAYKRVATQHGWEIPQGFDNMGR